MFYPPWSAATVGAKLQAQQQQLQQQQKPQPQQYAGSSRPCAPSSAKAAAPVALPRTDDAKYVPMGSSRQSQDTRPSSVMDLVARLSSSADAVAARDADGQRGVPSSPSKQRIGRSDSTRLTASATKPPASLTMPFMTAKASQASPPGSLRVSSPAPAKTNLRQKSPVALQRAASPGPTHHAGVTPPMSPKSPQPQMRRSVTPPLTPSSPKMAVRNVTRSMTPPRQLGQGACSITPPHSPVSSVVAPVQVSSSRPLSRGRAGSFRFTHIPAGAAGAAARSLTPPRTHEWSSNRSVRQLAANFRRQRLLSQPALSSQQASSASPPAPGMAGYHRSSGSSGPPLKAASTALARQIGVQKVSNGHGGAVGSSQVVASATVAAPSASGRGRLPNWQRGASGSGVYQRPAGVPPQLRNATPVQERDASPVLTQCSSSSSVRSAKLANPKSPNPSSAAALVPLSESSASSPSKEEKPASPPSNGSVGAAPETAVVLTLEMQREAAKRGFVNAGEDLAASSISEDLRADAAALKTAVDMWSGGVADLSALIQQMSPDAFRSRDILYNNQGTSTSVVTGSSETFGDPLGWLQREHQPVADSVHKDLDECGRTMMIYAASEGDVSTVEALLHEGAMIDSPDECGCTALTYAASRGHLSVVQCLARRGAELDAPTVEGWTPLIAAAASGHTEVVRCLVQTGAGVDLRDAKGWSALMHATFDRYLPTVLCLLDHGASSLVADAEGRTALAYAAYHGDLELAQALVQRHPSASRRADEAAGIALHNAVIQGHSEVSQCLLGMSLSRPVRAAAMKLAVQMGHFSIVESIVRQVHVDSQCFVPQAALP